MRLKYSAHQENLFYYLKKCFKFKQHVLIQFFFSFDFDSMLEDLNSAEENTVVILHAAAHNPTGKIIKKHFRKSLA